jgi:hypothetical protein
VEVPIADRAHSVSLARPTAPAYPSLRQHPIELITLPPLGGSPSRCPLIT